MRKFLFFISLLGCFSAFSQEYIFEHISSDDGLSNNLVRDITQDQQGYLWFATSGGLNRYDGYMFDVYRRVLGDTLSLSDSRLSVLFYDLNGFLWVRSTLGSVHRIDPSEHTVLNLSEMNILPPATTISNQYLSKNGDLWLYLNRGLARIYYKDKHAKEFHVQYFNKDNGLPDNVANFICDDSNFVWIGTRKGLVRLKSGADVTTGAFGVMNDGKEESFTSVASFDKHIYFGTGSKRFLEYDYNSGQMHDITEISQRLRGNITVMKVNNQQKILLGTSVGDVVLFDPYSKNFTYFERGESAALNASYISEIFADSYGVFWLITENRGVYQFNPVTKAFSYFDLNYQNRSFLGEPDKQIILEDSNHDLWIGINGGGLFLYNRDQKRFKQFKHNPDNTGSLSSDIVLSLYEDRSKNLWIGTSYGGINKISLKKEQLRKITPVEEPQTDFDNYIRSLTTDVLGNIWVGTKAGKIFVYRGSRKIGTIPDDLYLSGSFPSTNVYCLFFDNEHNLWIGSKGNGIYVFKSLLGYVNDLRNRNIDVVHFKYDPNNENSLSSDNVYSIKQDIYGQYWIGMLNGGLNLLTNPFTSPVFQHINSSGSSDGIISSEVRDLFFDRDQNLWVATSEGVSFLDKKYLISANKQFLNLLPSVTDSNSMAGKVVYQIRQTQNGDILLAMLDGGINRLRAEDFAVRNFKWIHQNSGVLSPNAYSLEQDNDGYIWMGTDNGLYRMNMADGVAEKYRVKDCSVPLTFSEGCSQKTIRQELIFGSNDGFLLFYPDSIQKDTTQFPLRFSLLEVNGENTPLQRNETSVNTAGEQCEVSLSSFQNNITLHFSVLDYNDRSTIQYSYFLEGYDSFWSAPTTSNVATYRKLPPGKYILQVKGTNSSGSWMRYPARLVIRISPPFWKSTLGYILIILIVSFIVTVSTILVYRQVYIQNRIRVENEITEKRIEYYTNISHEFKTPLSLILGPVEEIIMSHKSSDFARQKGIQIKKNAIYLKRLIEQILDFRKIREGKMQLKVSEVNLIEFFREIYWVFLPLAKKMEILFDYDYDEVVSGLGYVDIRHLEKITYNLLSNAFRFTPAGKQVNLVVHIDKENHTLEVRVDDEGTGIDEQELPKIFERFYNSKSSSGIGLFFTKEMVLLHKGKIDAYNNSHKGASFRVVVPIGKEAYADDEIDSTPKAQIAFDLGSIDDIEVIMDHNLPGEKVHRHVATYLETVLIVEDNNEMRNYLSSELSGKYKILEADDGEKGLELARKHSPDLILSDVHMPKMNGYELTRILKDDFATSHIPIILLTAESSEEKRIQGIECGADDYIIKPFNLSYLFTKIEKTIVQRKKLKKRFEQDIAEKSKPESEPDTGETDFLEKVHQLVIQNMAVPELNVEFLVEKMGVSRTLFFKKMKAACGYAPNEYLRIIRMKEAARLLTTTDKTISEISNAVGISDSNYFGKTFKKHFGETPSAYKSLNTKNRSI